MKLLTASLAAAMLAAGALPAGAALIEFRYQGQEFHYPGYPDWSPIWEPISASVFIDSDLYPLSSVAGSTIRLSYDLYESGYEMLDYVKIDLSKDNQHYTAEVHGASEWYGAGPSAARLYANDPGFRFIRFGGDITIGYAVSSMLQGIGLSIGQDLTVLSGGYSSGNLGGDEDHGWGTLGLDSYGDGAVSIGPGTWTTYVDGVPLAPVPLGPSAPLLALAIGGLAFAARRRRAG